MATPPSGFPSGPSGGGGPWGAPGGDPWSAWQTSIVYGIEDQFWDAWRKLHGMGGGSTSLDPVRTAHPNLPQRAPESLNDSTYGQIIPLSGGAREIRGRIIWYTMPRTITVPPVISASDGSLDLYQLVSTGDASGTIATVMDCAVSFGAPLASLGRRGIMRIKAGVGDARTIIYDRRVGETPVNATGLNFGFYQGDELQLPDPLIEASMGVGLTPAYRGQMYARFTDFPIDLFVEGDLPVLPAFGALIYDNVVAQVTNETFTVTTGSTLLTQPAVDWTGGLVYFPADDFRLVCFQLGGSHAERYDIPIVNLTSSFTDVVGPSLYVDGLQAVATAAIGDDEKIILIDPRTGRVFAESQSLTSGLVDEDVGRFAWGADLTGLTPIYIFAHLSANHGRMRVFSYDPELNAFAQVGGTTTNGLNGRDTATYSVSSIVRATNEESGTSVFYIAAGNTLVKLSPNLDDDDYTLTDVYTATTRILLLHYLPGERTIILFLDDGLAVKLDAETYDELWVADPGFTVGVPTTSEFMATTEGCRRTRPEFIWVNATTVYSLNLTDGSVESIAQTTSNRRRMVFDSEASSAIVMRTGGNPAHYTIGAGSIGTYSFSAIVTALADTSGYDDGVVTVSGVTDTVTGIIIDQEMEFRDFIYGHKELFNYEVKESENAISLTRIGDNPSSTFTIDRHDCVSGNEGPIVVRDEQESEMAASLEVRYRDANLDYAVTSQTVRRQGAPIPATSSRRRDTVETPIIMTADQALTLGTPALYRRIAGAVKMSAIAMPEFAALEPGDVGTINVGSLSYTVRIKTARLAPSFANQITAQVILTAGGTFTRTSDTGSLLPYTVTLKNPASFAYLLDGPILSKFDDLGGTGLAFAWTVSSRGQENWSGGQFFYSHDRVNYNAAVGTVTEDPLTGTVIGEVAAPPIPFTTDYTNTITVVQITGDFSSLTGGTYATIMDRLVYFGAPGRWEIIGYEDVDANSDGTYTFSGLRRGCYGTEVFADEHEAGDMFIPVEGALSSAFATTTIDDAVYYRGVGVRQRLGAAPDNTSTVSGNAERPPASCHLDAEVDGSDIDLSWVKRSRFIAHPDNWDVDDSETEDEWEVDILDGDDVVQTITGLISPSATYLDADITADFGSIAAARATGSWKVYRIGHLGDFSVGRGFAAEKSFSLLP